MCRERPVKGDRVEIVIDAGGATRNYEVTATRAGRRVGPDQASPPDEWAE